MLFTASDALRNMPGTMVLGNIGKPLPARDDFVLQALALVLLVAREYPQMGAHVPDEDLVALTVLADDPFPGGRQGGGGGLLAALHSLLRRRCSGSTVAGFFTPAASSMALVAVATL